MWQDGPSLGGHEEEGDDVALSCPKRGLEGLVTRLLPLPRKPASVRKQEKAARAKELQERLKAEQPIGRKVSPSFLNLH